jgi:type VI secretion system secreted protein Hcp
MAYDAYMYFEGGDPKVEGETKDSEMAKKKAFEIYSFSFGASNPTTIGSAGTGSGAGKVSLSSFNIMKKTDKASTALFLNCCQGSHFSKATVVLRKATGKAGQQIFVEYDFGGGQNPQVFVDSIQWSGSAGGDESPAESVSFVYSDVKITYFTQDQKGAMTKAGEASWDQTTNKLV